MSPKYALTSVQNAKHVSSYSSIRQGHCKIELCAAGAPIGADRMLSRSGKKSTKQKRRSVDYCIRQEFSAGAKRSDITMRTGICLNHSRRTAGARGQTGSAPELLDAFFHSGLRRNRNPGQRSAIAPQFPLLR